MNVSRINTKIDIDPQVSQVIAALAFVRMLTTNFLSSLLQSGLMKDPEDRLLLCLHVLFLRCKGVQQLNWTQSFTCRVMANYLTV